ncbi:hypothetical protein [Novosphingobium malaysiense]|uniref:hypothetical protein n=1 Tax=Novosphingobium malaysiense TaxID=1348853 RepID=UPI0018CD0C53|nr:hypothetical protein [Novosphingobium malaysiense]
MIVMNCLSLFWSLGVLAFYQAGSVTCDVSAADSPVVPIFAKIVLIEIQMICEAAVMFALDGDSILQRRSHSLSNFPEI